MCNGFNSNEGKEADLRTAPNRVCVITQYTSRMQPNNATGKLTMHARLLMRSALSTNPKAAGGTSGSLGGCVTPCRHESVSTCCHNRCKSATTADRAACYLLKGTAQ